MATLDQDARQLHEELKVLVLCLDENYLTSLAHWLRSAGIRVETAKSGWQAKQLLHGSDNRWVLITDRMLPPWPGLSRLALLKRSHKFLRIVGIDRGDADSRYIAWAAGADAVVSPPLRRDAVMQAIRVAQGSDRG